MADKNDMIDVDDHDIWKEYLIFNKPSLRWSVSGQKMGKSGSFTFESTTTWSGSILINIKIKDDYRFHFDCHFDKH